MLCPPREPGLRPPPLRPPQPFPTAQPNFNRKPQPSALGFPVRLEQHRGEQQLQGTKPARAKGPGPGWPHTLLSPTLPSSLILISGWSGLRQGGALGKEERKEPTGGKTRGRNLKNSNVKGFSFILLVKNYGFLMFQTKRDRDTERMIMRLCVRSRRRNWSP